ncbi:MAG: hypothetical protein QM715_01655 [Nibricoccus sp.]
MKHTNAQTAQTPGELLDELRALVAEAEQMAADSVSEYTAEAVGALRARFEKTYDRLAELYGGLRRKVVAGAECADAAIREKPYQALAIAAGAGLLAGVLLCRRGT